MPQQKKGSSESAVAKGAAATKANNCVNIGVIGCGRAGVNHILCLKEMKDANVAVTAVCDIFEPRKEEAKKLTGARVFHDYREMLERKDIDAVIVATPDHWHARMCIDAMNAGKDVYCEEPFTLRWDEAKEVKRVVNRTRRTLQVGAVTCSDPRWNKANELIQQGKLGRIVWSQASITRNSLEGDWNDIQLDVAVTPKNLDWERFLGSAPKRPFEPERFLRHGKYWDYSAGWIADAFSCGLYGLLKAMGPQHPKRVVAEGGHFVFPDREVPDTLHIIADYPSEHTVVILSCTANEKGLPVMIRAKEATMSFGKDNISIRPQRVYSVDHEPLQVKVVPVEDLHKEHLRNFIDCVRGKGRPNCDIDLTYKVTVAMAMGVLSYREKKVKFFDAEKEEVL